VKTFSIGERVVVRDGRGGDRRARVLARQSAAVYVVRLADGTLAYHSGVSLRSAATDPPLCSPHYGSLLVIPSRN
jgi:hypothetical protein